MSNEIHQTYEPRCTNNTELLVYKQTSSSSFGW